MGEYSFNKQLSDLRLKIRIEMDFLTMPPGEQVRLLSLVSSRSKNCGREDYSTICSSSTNDDDDDLNSNNSISKQCQKNERTRC